MLVKSSSLPFKSLLSLGCQALCQGNRTCMFKADKTHPPGVHLCYHTECPCGLPFIQDDRIRKLKE